MNKQANNVVSIIPRFAPVSDKAMIFYPDTRSEGQIDTYVDGKRLRVGIDVYMATERLTEADSKKIALDYAKHENIDPARLVVRQRLPKTNVAPAKRARRTNDSNLVLVKEDKKGAQESSQDYRSLVERKQDELAEMAQALHDGETKQEEPKASVDNSESARASASNPEGAVVQQPRQKRAYKKKNDKEISARSRAALARFHKEVAAATKESETIMKPVAPAPNVDPEFAREQKLLAAMKLSKEILGEVRADFVKTILNSDLL